VSEQKLTTKQRLFVEAYLANPNATEAARKAGYKGNDQTLKQVGSENLAKPYLAALVEKRVEAAVMTANEVLMELATIAKGPHKTYRSDKIKSLELLGKYHKLFTDRVEVLDVTSLTDEELDAVIGFKGRS
jgi:phage terminase small subunit